MPRGGHPFPLADNAPGRRHPLLTMSLKTITHELVRDLRPLRFGKPVHHVYNPLEYARECWDQYVDRYGQGTREVVFVGMNRC